MHHDPTRAPHRQTQQQEPLQTQQQEQEKASAQQRRQEPGVLAALFQTALQQLFGRRKDRLWRAYTRSGKIVLIHDRQVLDIIDPKQVPDK